MLSDREHNLFGDRHEIEGNLAAQMSTASAKRDRLSGEERRTSVTRPIPYGASVVQVLKILLGP